MRRGLACAAAAAAALALTPPAAGAPTTTLERTIQDCEHEGDRDCDNLLQYEAGEDYSVIGAPEDFRPPRDGSILNFLQLTDFQLIDEESPGRVEFLDTTQRGPFAPFSAAYRPQESLTTQVQEAMVRAARNTVSPVTGERLDLTILTGDSADSQQFNETRWFIDIMDGTDGGENPDPEMENPPDGNSDRKIEPDTGIPSPACPGTPGSVYDGLRGGGRPGYYEPDRSVRDVDDGDGYSPFEQENGEETGRFDVKVRDFPGLFEAANGPFEAVGVDMPWYSAFGNHDALVQGNSSGAFFGPRGDKAGRAANSEVVNEAYRDIVTGCLKPSKAQFADPGQFTPDLPPQPADGFNPLQPGNALFGSPAFVVPPDPRRCHVAKDEEDGGAGSEPPCTTGGWIQQHFRTSGAPLGHGFVPQVAADCAFVPEPQRAGCASESGALDPSADLGRPHEAIEHHDGYYSFLPAPGLRFVVLDTITDECGFETCSEGSVDDTQFQWLRRQLMEAESEEQYVMVFSHHTLPTTRSPTTDATEIPVHYGLRVDRENPLNPQNITVGDTLEELYCQHPSVLAHVAGHEHVNFVREHECPGGPRRFYHVSTAAHIDWPQQSRMIELVDNGDGTLSLVLTILDHDGPAYPGGHPPSVDGDGHAGQEPVHLASIAREIAYNDYQQGRGSRGGTGDRNVIVVTDDPYAGP
jgi:hypothetical protein